MATERNLGDQYPQDKLTDQNPPINEADAKRQYSAGINFLETQFSPDSPEWKKPSLLLLEDLKDLQERKQRLYDLEQSPPTTRQGGFTQSNIGYTVGMAQGLYVAKLDTILERAAHDTRYNHLAVETAEIIPRMEALNMILHPESPFLATATSLMEVRNGLVKKLASTQEEQQQEMDIQS